MLAMLPLSAQLKDFMVSKVSKLRNSSASCNSQSPLYGGPRKALNACKILWHVAAYSLGIDGWVPFAKYWGPGPQDWCTPYVATEHRQVRQASLPVNFSCREDSLSVTDSGSHSGTLFEAPFVDFCVTKFRQNFLRRHPKENGMLKILAECHSGALFQPGAIRTCVPCLMVDPALVFTVWSGGHT